MPRDPEIIHCTNTEILIPDFFEALGSQEYISYEHFAIASGKTNMPRKSRVLSADRRPERVQRAHSNPEPGPLNQYDNIRDCRHLSYVPNIAGVHRKWHRPYMLINARVLNEEDIAIEGDCSAI